MLSPSPDFYHVLSWDEYKKVPSISNGRGGSWTATTEFPTTDAWDWPPTGLVMDLDIDHDRSEVLSAWVQAGHEPDLVLQHEQGHFNIHALVYREFWDRAPAMGYTTARAWWFDTLLPRLRALEGQGGAYEISTEFGNNSTNQALWNSQFDDLLTRGGGNSEDLNNWVNDTPFTDGDGHQIVVPQVP